MTVNTVSSFVKSQAATEIQRLFRGFVIRKAEQNRATCGICLEDDRRTHLREICLSKESGSSGHVFHIECARGYFSTVRTPVCPNCRADLSNISAAQTALSSLGARYSNYIEPVMTVNEALNNYQSLIIDLPVNPTEAQRREVIKSFKSWQLLSQNQASIA